MLERNSDPGLVKAQRNITSDATLQLGSQIKLIQSLRYLRKSNGQQGGQYYLEH
jgi:hypothetical protein